MTGKTETKEKRKPSEVILGGIHDFVEMLALVTVVIMLVFAFVARLNIVNGQSMEPTLHNGEYLLVSNFMYSPTPGDIVVVHKINASYAHPNSSFVESYTDPIVKRVIATAGQTVKIDFTDWTLFVDGEEIAESYRYLDPASATIIAQYGLSTDSNGHTVFSVTVGDGQVFVMGDNRNHSADSRTNAIGLIDERCVVGKALIRLFPFNKFTVFQNPR